VSENSLELITLNGVARTMDEAITEAAEMLIQAGAVEAGYKESMFARESSVSTYMGNYLAIPHGTLDGSNLVKKSALAIIRYGSPISWGGEQVKFVVGIAGKNDEHLESLGRIAEIFSNSATVQNILNAETEGEIRQIFAGGTSA
jgi:mannitol/fructose-specific phosphotransferase system IIA component